MPRRDDDDDGYDGIENQGHRIDYSDMSPEHGKQYTWILVKHY